MLAYLINTYALENGVRAPCPSRGGLGGLQGQPRGTQGPLLGRHQCSSMGLKMLFLLLQVSSMAEMKSYSQAITGVSTMWARG